MNSRPTIRGSIANRRNACGFGRSSPLTPALSPLRGEGVASATKRSSETLRRVPTSWSAEPRSATERGVHAASTPECPPAPNAVNKILPTTRVDRAPSPLNGERIRRKRISRFEPLNQSPAPALALTLTRNPNLLRSTRLRLRLGARVRMRFGERAGVRGEAVRSIILRRFQNTVQIWMICSHLGGSL